MIAHSSLSIALPSPTMTDDTAIVTPISQRVDEDFITGFPKLPMEMSLLDLLMDNGIPSPQVKPQEVTKKSTTSIKKANTSKDPKRDTSVSFEEMKRLMRVYGPTKVLRNRVPKETGRVVKPESIRRKFYRWFPDFTERFLQTPGGWYTPKAGHQHEMDYREAMRKMDQEVLVRKRGATKRYNTKTRQIRV